MGLKNCPKCGRFVPGYEDRKYCDRCEKMETLRTENEALKKRLSLIEPPGFNESRVTLRIDSQDLNESLEDSVPKVKAFLALGVDCIRIMKEE